MSKDKGIDILFPPGRFVQGNLYTPNTTNAEGGPLVYKTGDKAGQPRVDYYIACAIPKQPGHTHWAQTDWGAKIWAHAHAQWPQGQAQRPDFAWKIEDGDSQIPNKKGNKPCDATGFAGHWVVKFGGGTQPKIVNKDGSAAILEPKAVKTGYYVQIFGSVASNESAQTAGIYMNHRIVALAGFGEEIAFGPDPSSVGFGGAPLPPGASATPVGNMTPPATGAAPLPPGAPPPVPGIASPVPGAAFAGSPPPVPGAVPVPSTTFVANAAGVAPPPPGAAAPPPPPSTPVRVMLPAAGATTYEGFIAAGWTDAALVQHGMMAP